VSMVMSGMSLPPSVQASYYRIHDLASGILGGSGLQCAIFLD